MTPKKLYKIGEVIRYSGISRQTLHNYTMLGLIREVERTESGHRLYGPDVFERLERVIALKKEEKTLRDIQDIISREFAEKVM
jgi:DNA-binding transcriptional MerR regulator